MEVIEVEGGVAVLLSKQFGNSCIFEFVVEEGPLVAKSDHDFDAFLTLLLERCGGGGLLRGVRCQYRFRTGCHPLFLLWE